MDYQQIRLKAEAGCSYLKDKNSYLIYVASADDPVVTGVLDSLRAEAVKNNIDAEVIAAGSLGLYDLEPIAVINKPDNSTTLHHNVTGESVPDFTKDNPGTELPALNLQNRVALRTCGYIDPENIGEYILKENGYRGLSDALQMERTELARKLNVPGPSGEEACERYIICNALDCDPDELTSKLLLEGDPHSVLEGFLINARAFGATRGYICINEEYETAIKRLRLALEQMKEYNLLGDNILESDFSCDIEVKEVPSSLVMKDETALIRCLAGKQPIPYLITTPLAEKGLNDMPTLLVDAESPARTAAVTRNEKAPETRILTLCGDINHKYTVEVPAGITPRQIIEDIGGGIPGGGIKAIRAGGRTGRFLSPDTLDSPLVNILADSPGVIEISNDNSSMVEKTKDTMGYLQGQSCGKCVFCREGTLQIADILEDITAGKASPDDLELVQKLCEGMIQGSICYLGKKAADPVLSSLELFGNEYDYYLKKK
ncbi:MAG: NADH-ubiquinone oxidoreductase-F iron-sulfur binding region domain-containing protein [Dehalococcoidia bacterium]|jgi:NADH:ubiquinone oxidoreductase subunit F (NADH-binding)